MASIHEQVDQASLGVIPNPIKLGRAMIRPSKPFVMINMLSFKEHATGDYSHLTGEEAYKQYAQSVQKAQAPLGSRLLWSGNVQEKVTEGCAPNFYSIALLEYASPRAFLQFLTKGGSNTKARGAGLRGQWLISSTTLEASELPDSDEAYVVLIELGGGMRQNPEARKRWKVRKSTYRVAGAKTVWHGRCDQHILGTAVPGIEEVLVTWFPSTRVLEHVISDSIREESLLGFRPYLAYTADSMVGFLPELSPSSTQAK